MLEVMTRRKAAEAGLKRYYTGKPCSKGHDSPRFTSTGACVKCAAGYAKGYADRLKKETNARIAGFFSYPLHPDDVAAALAYCQALDLQRGRQPYAPSVAPPAPASPFQTVDDLPAHIARHREKVKADYAAPSAPDYLPKP